MTNTKRRPEIRLVRPPVSLCRFLLVKLGCYFNHIKRLNLAYLKGIVSADSIHHSLRYYQSLLSLLYGRFPYFQNFIKLPEELENGCRAFHLFHVYCIIQLKLYRFVGLWGLSLSVQCLFYDLHTGTSSSNDLPSLPEVSNPESSSAICFLIPVLSTPSNTNSE